MEHLISFLLPFSRDFAIEWPFWQNGRPAGTKWFFKSSYETSLYRTTELWLGNVHFLWDAPRRKSEANAPV